MPKIAKNPDIRRMCSICADLLPETSYKGKKWICPNCEGVEATIRLQTRMGTEVFDTKEIFAGYKLRKVRLGATRNEYENELPCRLGTFYAVAGNVVGFETKSGKTAGIIKREFPQAKLFTSSDDGQSVFHIPVSLFPAIAERVGARKKRQLSPEARSKASERLKAMHARKKAVSAAK